MRRAKALLAYDGSKFMGFQRQADTADTVCGRIESALKSLGVESKVGGAGRTDRGVHASGQVVAFDLPDFWHDFEKLRRHLNDKLDGSIHFKHLSPAPLGFDPRRHALRRAYRYLLSTQEPSPFMYDYVSFVPKFSKSKMDEALGAFVGRHNFEFFRKQDDGKTDFVRTIYRARRYERFGLHIVSFEANSFLRSQIRLMTAFALKVATNELTIEQLKAQLRCEERFYGKPASPNGLYLCRVVYAQNAS